MALALDRGESPARGRARARAEKRRSRAARPRRDFTVSLPNTAGAELRLPALPRVRISSRTLSVLMLGLVAFAGYSAWTDERFVVREAIVEGASLMSEAQVRSIAKLRDLRTFLVDTDAVERRLESYPEIDAADVSVSWPSKVTVTVEERRPVIEWDDGGKTWWLSASGVAFIQRDDTAPTVIVRSEVPVLNIDVNALEPAISSELLWDAVSLSQRVKTAGELTYSVEGGLGFVDTRGWAAHFGHGGDLELKLKVYEEIAEQIVELGVRAELVSVADPFAPYYRLAR